MLMATIDSEQGVRVDPPPAGQLYYKAFLPGPGLLDRADRIENPAELSLVEKDGRVSGQLRLIGSVWKDGRDRPELEIAHRPVSGPQDLRQALEAEAERMKKAQRSPPLKVLLVFAPATLTHGQLLGFLDPVLPTYRIVHVFLDQPLPPIPAKNP
ncbi:MAG: hypothetical protein NTV49_03300 [Kiritimatiellaeota bacterium]|nr:hypothetical protein [Kiritimatiellota bacterium]